MLIDFSLRAVFSITFLSIVSSDIPICLTWRQHNNCLQLVCRVNELHLPVSLIDPANEELVRCYSVGIQYNCFHHVSGVDIIQNPSTNETVFSVDRSLYSNINGNWTCRHGTLGDEASVEVDICNNRDQKSPVLNVFAWTFAGFGIVFLIIEILTVFLHYRDKHYSTLIKWIDKCVIDSSNVRIARFRILVFLMLTALVGINIVIATVKQQEDSIQGQALCVMIGMGFAVFVYVFEVSTKRGSMNRFKVFKAQSDVSKLPLKDFAAEDSGFNVDSEVVTESEDELKQSQVVTESEDDSKQSQVRICCGEAKDHGGGINLKKNIVVLGNEKEVDVFILSLNRIADELNYITSIHGDTQNTQLDYLLITYEFVFILFTENFKVDNLGFTRVDIEKIQCMELYPKIKIICKCRRDLVIKAFGRIDLDFQNNIWDDFMKPYSTFYHILRQLPTYGSRKKKKTDFQRKNHSKRLMIQERNVT